MIHEAPWWFPIAFVVIVVGIPIGILDVLLTVFLKRKFGSGWKGKLLKLGAAILGYFFIGFIVAAILSFFQPIRSDEFFMYLVYWPFMLLLSYAPFK